MSANDETRNTPQNTQEAKAILMKQMMEKRQRERKEELVQVVMRQTDYDESKAREKLEEHNYDVMQTIREYMNPESSSENCESTDKSKNQKLYGEFRKLLDDAAKNYRIEKEQEEKRAKYLQMLQQKHNEAANSLKNKTE
jgi:hypothetical protein